MVNIKLSRVFVEHSWKPFLQPFGQPGTRWYALVALALEDLSLDKTPAPVAEWFYLVACSEEYIKRPSSKGPLLDEKFLIVQQSFNLLEIEKAAQERIASIKAESWDEFYEKMQLYFLYED